ncbi:hypothetical protein K7X08_002021 [Anisodus acutangulus]|uniref:Uncharacterized protein n=1 Tax=Anisodus acutangulus TaxID=402998 RepID=A0A9Q1R5J8_9SOLA|nr:hypothetical protein K7X08_002021 [Anisodus acutangulus]
MILNPYSWTKVASIIFLDFPVGIGFSYARTPAALQSSDLQASDHAYQVLRKGYILGNPSTFEGEKNYEIPFAYGMGLISDELYESLKANCKGEYLNIDPSNTLCLQDVQTFHPQGINNPHILEPKCKRYSPRPHQLFGQRRSLDEKFHELNNLQQLPALKCRTDWYKLSYHWADDGQVRDALNIRKGTIGKWERCATLCWKLAFGGEMRPPIFDELNTSVPGDHDKAVTFQSTKAWIKSLNYYVINDWRPWTVDNQVACYTRSYSNWMTFATVKGAGHTAPEYKPRECLAMLKRWMSYKPL